MDIRSLARNLAMNRMSFGAGLMLAPGLYARTWIGAPARDERVKVLARALGARDLALGAGGLVALRAGDEQRALQWFAAQGVSDAVDLAATLAAGANVKLPARIFAATIAAGSAGIAAAYVRAVASAAGERRPS